MKKIFIFLVNLSFLFVSSQEKIDVKYLFKTYLFINSKAQKKDFDSFTSFNNTLEIKLDSLKITGNYDLTNEVFSPKFSYYKLSFDYSKMTNKNIITESDKILSNLFTGPYSDFIIAINYKTGKSYRLQGFDNNDFTGFLSDYKEEYLENSSKNLSTIFFLNHYFVENLDFKCLFKEIQNNKINRRKTSCLKRVNDPYIIIN